MIEIHGTLLVWRCVVCGREDEEMGEALFGEYPVMCECGGMMRPDVVWFGEMLPEGAMERVGEAIGACDVFMSLGTSSLVEPAANFVYGAKRRGAVTVEVNREATGISEEVDYVLRGKSGEVLPRFVAAVKT